MTAAPDGRKLNMGSKSQMRDGAHRTEREVDHKLSLLMFSKKKLHAPALISCSGSGGAATISLLISFWSTFPSRSRHRGRHHGFKIWLGGFIDDGCRSRFGREVGVPEMVGGLREPCKAHTAPRTRDRSSFRPDRFDALTRWSDGSSKPSREYGKSGEIRLLRRYRRLPVFPAAHLP